MTNKGKKITAIVAILLAVTVVGGGVAWYKSTLGITAMAQNLRFSASAGSSKYEEMYSFYDDDYYYHAFYLGRLDHVPLQDNAPTYEYKGNRYTKELTTSVTDSQTIESCISNATSECVSYSLTLSTTASVGVEEQGISASIERGVSRTMSVGGNVSKSQSVTKAETYSKTVSDTTKFEFNDKTEKGFYRYVLFGDIDVFGLVIKDLDTGEWYRETYEIIVSQYYSLDYSKTSTFDDNAYGELKLEISENKLNNLPDPKTYIGDIAAWIWTYDNTTSKKIDASNVYENIDRFNFAEVKDRHDFTKYMTSKYVLRFNIKITMKENSEGYQEISLCNSNGEVVWGVGDNYSYKGGSKGDKGVEEWTIEVPGDKCTSEMYMSYGAHGKYSDDWTRYECHVVVTLAAKN